MHGICHRPLQGALFCLNCATVTARNASLYAICQDTRIIDVTIIWRCGIEPGKAASKKAPETGAFLQHILVGGAIRCAPPVTYYSESKPRKIAIPHGKLGALHQEIVNNRNELSKQAVGRSKADGGSFGHWRAFRS